ncbi:hypothetical protein ACU5P1_10180 [Pseudomonas plecoglossicida]|uniref:Secreted protein n=1 Tax=Pseudomonas plecoglossicida TaxID=70775 RepID=A0AAD0QUH4_PSEDL|nr:hypothetical protein [Pseudomonas plecoglossicida]AXM94429.1 hypothetical protein DVB73_00585 [Pseudomonas plecoglossicida]EPB95406.1 hypothetical protein L321_14356 [Pseudomonas plecoglossicida NB2011]QLB55165.1 hypothetical protein HAV28_10105 [Pseudomonas plecoglossicida]GLR35202.1 hypothetical protein GCM10011247_05990 [Pseudomonas plecoglossicida]
MNYLKSFAIGSVLFALMGSAFAEGGHERAVQFNENFRAEQARLWSDDSFDQNKQQVAQEQQKVRKGDQEQADN